MDRHIGRQTTLSRALLRDLYLGNKMDRHEGLQTTLTIALLKGL
jgi:hypothetical protein